MVSRSIASRRSTPPSTWFVDRGVIHKEGADRVRAQAAGDEALEARDLARVQRVRSALREVSHAIAAHRAPGTGALDTINRALHARQVIELVPAPDGCTSTIATSATRSTTRWRAWPIRS